MDLVLFTASSEQRSAAQKLTRRVVGPGDHFVKGLKGGEAANLGRGGFLFLFQHTLESLLTMKNNRMMKCGLPRGWCELCLTDWPEDLFAHDDRVVWHLRGKQARMAGSTCD